MNTSPGNPYSPRTRSSTRPTTTKVALSASATFRLRFQYLRPGLIRQSFHAQGTFTETGPAREPRRPPSSGGIREHWPRLPLSRALQDLAGLLKRIPGMRRLLTTGLLL